MNKNILLSVLGIFILIGAIYVLSGVLTSIDSVSVNLNGSVVRGVSNWTSANESGGNVINFTIFTTASSSENLTLINISILRPTGYIEVNATANEILNLTYNQTIHYSRMPNGGDANVSSVTCGQSTANNMVYCYNNTGGIATNISGRPGGGGNNLWFYIDANNTGGVASVEGVLTWNISVRSNSTSYAGGTIASITTTAMGIDNLAPRFIEMNISNTDGTNNVGSRNNNTAKSGFSASLGAINTSFIKNGTDVVVRVVINESNLINSSVYLLWNISAVPVTYTERTIGVDQGSNRRSGNMTLNASSASRQDTRPASQLRTFNLVIDKGNLTDQGVLSLAIFANDTFNQTLRNNNTGLGYNVVIDGTAPSSSITMPTVTTIDVQKSITIKCYGDDANGGSGATSVELTITKPSGTTVTKDVTDDNEHKFTGSDTGEAGEYKVDCTTTDTVGFTGSATQEKFRTLYSTVPGAKEPVPEKVAPEIPAEGETKGLKQGESVTYTILGEDHKITVDVVGEDEVTLLIESDPIKVAIKVGGTKVVDLDGDGSNDLEITLNSIADKKADLTFKDISAKEEEVEEEVAPEEEIVTAPSRARVVGITVLVIVVILIIIFIAVKGKRGKKGQIRFSREELSGSSGDLIGSDEL